MITMFGHREMRNDITDRDIANFWLKWAVVILLRFPVEILSVVLFPLSYWMRYKVQVDLFYYLLNSTKDGDYGADWWLEREGLKKSFWSAWRWTLRNPAWNFNEIIKPVWTGYYTDVRVIENTIGGDNPLIWADHYSETYGTNHVYYRVKGKVYGRYSTTELAIGKRFQAGTEGKRYNLRFTL